MASGKSEVKEESRSCEEVRVELNSTVDVVMLRAARQDFSGG